MKKIFLVVLVFTILLLLHLHIQTLAESNVIWISFLAPFTIGFTTGSESFHNYGHTPLTSPYTAIRAAILYTVIIFGIYRLYDRKKRTGMPMLKGSFTLRK
jgi:hypothetical protein